MSLDLYVSYSNDAYSDVQSYDMTADAMPAVIGDEGAAIPTASIASKVRDTFTNPRQYGILYGDTMTKVKLHVKHQNFDASDTMFGRVNGSGRNGSLMSNGLDNLLQYINVDVVISAPAFTESYSSMVARWASAANLLPAVAAFAVEGFSGTAPVLPGYSGNLWNYIKQFCVVYEAEIIVRDSTIVLRPAQNKSITLPEFTDMPERAEATELVKDLEVAYYNYTLAVNKVFATADQVYQLAAGEKQVVTLSCVGTPASLLQPTASTGIFPIPYTGGGSTYVVTGADGYIIAPAFWEDKGGSITAAIDPDNPQQVIVTMQAPADTARAPYRISEGAADRPALYICGTGVLIERKTLIVPTASGATRGTQEIDNPCISTSNQARSLGVNAAQQYAIPQMSTSLTTTPDHLLYSNPVDGRFVQDVAGMFFRANGNKYRVNNVNLNNGIVSLQMTAAATCADWNAIWGTKQWSDFNTFNTVTYPSRWSDFGTTPLAVPE